MGLNWEQKKTIVLKVEFYLQCYGIKLLLFCPRARSKIDLAAAAAANSVGIATATATATPGDLTLSKGVDFCCDSLDHSSLKDRIPITCFSIWMMKSVSGWFFVWKLKILNMGYP